jgi:hypothetical protein
MKTRITVFLAFPETDEPELEGEPMREWVHPEAYSDDERGVLLDWGGGASSFFPWTSVLRVERERCRCVECKRTS